MKSHHQVHDPDLYTQNAINGFSQFFGPPSDYTWLALLPSYLERENASLVFMVKQFMESSGHAENGFYLDDLSLLADRISILERQDRAIVLIGVSFALLELAERHPMQLTNTLVIETGGMKGRREELTREELHNRLKMGFGLEKIGSEYGMTELLSQAWSHHDGIYRPSATMRLSIRDIYDPLTELPVERRGAVAIIDLANLDSCAFIATEDIGICHVDGSFEILGRMDASELRGCNLMLGEFN